MFEAEEAGPAAVAVPAVVDGVLGPVQLPEMLYPLYAQPWI